MGVRAVSGPPRRELQAPAPRRPLPGQHRRDPVDERPGPATAGRRRLARRLQPLHPPPGGRPLARAPRRARPTSARAVEGPRGAAAAHRPLPFHVRADAGPPVAAVPDPAGVPEALGDAVPRLGHPRQGAGGARVREEGRRRDRRELRRDPLGARGDGDPSRHRPRPRHAGAALRTATAGGRPCAVVAAPEGDGPRRPRVRGPRRRPADRRRAPPRRGARALPGRGHRRRPAERRLVRPVRHRVHGARQARRHVPARRGDATHGGCIRPAGAARQRVGRDPARPTRGARRARRRPAREEIGRASRAYASGSTTSTASPMRCSRSTRPSSSRRRARRLGRACPAQPADLATRAAMADDRPRHGAARGTPGSPPPSARRVGARARVASCVASGAIPRSTGSAASCRA